jgi:AraC-like DNA-binding protein
LSVAVPESGSHSVAVALLANLRRARDHLNRHHREPLDLDGIAWVAGTSKYHFRRSFEAAYGETKDFTHDNFNCVDSGVILTRCG